MTLESLKIIADRSASAAAAPGSVGTCRLCGGDTDPAFSAELMAKYQVNYGVCQTCGSLQTELPFWLDEAYASNLGDRDCGAAQRNLHNFAACYSMARIWGARTAIDFGGGDGLLTRLLRDRHVDCHVEDKYGSPTYALAFARPEGLHPDALFAFEVFEHFVEPAKEIAALFARQPKILFGTTGRFTGQGADWWYLSHQSGHHVFFFSSRALSHVARVHDYVLIEQGAFFLFVRRDAYSPVKAMLSRRMLSSIARKLVMAVASVLPATGIGRDIELLRGAGGR